MDAEYSTLREKYKALRLGFFSTWDMATYDESQKLYEEIKSFCISSGGDLAELNDFFAQIDANAIWPSWG